MRSGRVTVESADDISEMRDVIGSDLKVTKRHFLSILTDFTTSPVERINMLSGINVRAPNLRPDADLLISVVAGLQSYPFYLWRQAWPFD